MSESLAHGRGSTKVTCSNCKRTVRLERLATGEEIACDPELVTIIAKRGRSANRPADLPVAPADVTHGGWKASTSVRVNGYRRHDVVACERYKLEDEKARWRKENAPKKPTVREQRAQIKAANAAKRAANPSDTASEKEAIERRKVEREAKRRAQRARELSGADGFPRNP